MKRGRVTKASGTLVGTAEAQATPTAHRGVGDVKIDADGHVERAPTRAYFAAARKSRQATRNFIREQREELLSDS